MKPDFLPIVINEFKNRNYNFYLFERPDICFYEIKIPKEDQIFSMEKYILNYDEKYEAKEIVIWGFPLVHLPFQNLI